jgi:hypothetical protein
MSLTRTTYLAIACFLLAGSTHTAAQSAVASGGGRLLMPAVPGSAGSHGAEESATFGARGLDWSDNASLQERASRKEPVLGGLLSWILPGLGSYYAGNSGHGTRHLVIWAGSIAVIVIGVSQTEDGFSTGSSDALILGGLAALVTNTVWAIITGVNDANAYNRQHNLASIVQPELKVLSTVSGSALEFHRSNGPRVGLQLVKIGF